MSLESIRKEIDAIDESIIELIRQRLSFSTEIAHEKIKNNLQLRDAAREKEILKKYIQIAEKKGIDKKLIEKIFMLLIEGSVSLQEKEINKGDKK